MRHSDPSLTANVYTDPQLLDVAGAVAWGGACRTCCWVGWPHTEFPPCHGDEFLAGGKHILTMLAMRFDARPGPP